MGDPGNRKHISSIHTTHDTSTSTSTFTSRFYLLTLLLLFAFSATLSWKSFTSHRGSSPTSAPNYSIYVSSTWRSRSGRHVSNLSSASRLPDKLPEKRHSLMSARQTVLFLYKTRRKNNHDERFRRVQARSYHVWKRRAPARI